MHRLVALAAALCAALVGIGLAGSSSSANPHAARAVGCVARWRAVAHGTSVPILDSVAAVSATDVWMAGSSGESPVIAHWDGHSFRFIRPVAGPGDLTGIAAVDHGDVWAVGYSGKTTAVRRPLVLHWDGARWRSLTVPVPIGSLSDVRAFSASSVWAVGGAGNGAASVRAIVLVWNGRTWRTTFLGARESSLSALDGSSPDDIWAVGGARLDAPLMASQEPLVIHWDALGWRESYRQKSGSFVPNVDPWIIDFGAVTVRDRNDIWSLAHHFADYGEYVLHWNGKRQRVADEDLGNAWFLDIAAPSAKDVWAVGRLGYEPSRPLVARWTGYSFESQVTSFDQLRNGSLNAASALSAVEIWAVGDHLVARYSC